MSRSIMPAVVIAFFVVTLFFFALSVVDVSARKHLEIVETQDNPITPTEESVSAGRQIFGRFFRSCHGVRADGRGMAAPPGSQPANLIDDVWDHGSSDAEMFKVIKEGVPPKYDMDAWDGRVSDDDIWNVINYLRDLTAE